MKKIIIILIVASVFAQPVFAEEITVSGDDIEDNFEVDKYVPEYLNEILKNNGDYNIEEVGVSEIFRLLGSYLKASVEDYAPMVLRLFCIIFVLSIFKRINDNYDNLMILSYVFVVAVSYEMIDIFMLGCEHVTEVLDADSQLLGALLPSFVTVMLIGGGTLSSVNASASFGIVLSTLEFLLSDVVVALVVIMSVFLIFEKISPVFEEIHFLKHLKKYVMITVSFVTTVMVTVLSYQSVLSARADSLSARSVKFAAANFIPIVGNAVGESFRTVSAGVSYLKTALGGMSALALFFIVFPIISELFVLKVLLSFTGFTAGMCGCEKEKGYIDGCINIIDILLAIIICCAILSFLLVFLFAFIAFGV